MKYVELELVLTEGTIGSVPTPIILGMQNLKAERFFPDEIFEHVRRGRVDGLVALVRASKNNASADARYMHLALSANIAYQ